MKQSISVSLAALAATASAQLGYGNQSSQSVPPYSTGTVPPYTTTSVTPYGTGSVPVAPTMYNTTWAPTSSCTDTDTVTSTYCPSCELATMTPPVVHTTVYTTTWSAWCPTGLTPKPYTITETCTGPTPSYSSCSTCVPKGYTTTVSKCTICSVSTTATLTVPCPETETETKTGTITYTAPTTYSATATVPYVPSTGLPIPPSYKPVPSGSTTVYVPSYSKPTESATVYLPSYSKPVPSVPVPSVPVPSVPVPSVPVPSVPVPSVPVPSVPAPSVPVPSMPVSSPSIVPIPNSANQGSFKVTSLLAGLFGGITAAAFML